jgi:hypothetical protein
VPTDVILGLRFDAQDDLIYHLRLAYRGVDVRATGVLVDDAESNVDALECIVFYSLNDLIKALETAKVPT